MDINNSIEIPDTEFHFSFARSGGPGGQNVNKVNSKALLRWDVLKSDSLPPPVKDRFAKKYSGRLTNEGEIVIQSQKYRDQGRNIADCLEKLRQMILTVVAPPVKRRRTKPTRGSQQRRLQNKKAQSEKKQSRRKPTFND